ncbi:transmembrane protein 207 [Gracilinanus agilis]|uniref:transmembrane protein 207 n=1 Tax=Gracilinanus agilis TaxID=191870 RepID=UPI001CFC6C4C|nr:transmembrane protein 207 [Gracilinanus agilis]
MWPPERASLTSLLSRSGAIGLTFIQQPSRCVSSDEQPLNGWYIWWLMLLSLISIICCMVLICLHCWLKRSHSRSSGRTVAVFAVSDIESISGTESVTNPTARLDLHSPDPELYSGSCIIPLGPPPPYEDTQKTSRL